HDILLLILTFAARVSTSQHLGLKAHSACRSRGVKTDQCYGRKLALCPLVSPWSSDSQIASPEVFVSRFVSIDYYAGIVTKNMHRVLVTCPAQSAPTIRTEPHSVRVLVK
ncbi:hypothetical protein NQ315_011374, partial [Exocentrus adspersus]